MKAPSLHKRNSPLTLKSLALTFAALGSLAAAPAEARHHRAPVRGDAPALLACDNNGRCVMRPVAQARRSNPARTRRANRHAEQRRAVDASGNVVRSHKTGATARVGAAYVAAFQAYIDDLESNGAVVRFMGGIRAGRCSSRSMHPCGRALDVCQRRRGVVDRRCDLPRPAAIAAIAARHGLFEGGQWCHSDYGHAQAGVSAAVCGQAYSARRRSRSGR